jgi:SAM-dependent methyltransferase
MEPLEISDLIVDFDLETLRRKPVVKRVVVDAFLARGNRRAARIVAALPERDGVLDPGAVDRVLLRAHYELQQMSEEFYHGQRAYEFLRPLLTALRAGGAAPPFRVVDLGCGIGYVVRWLAAHTELTDEVELIGADYNVALVEEAQRLAAKEHLRCSFVVANAFRLPRAATVYLSTGVIHHFRNDALREFFTRHDRPESLAFAHFDFQPSFFAPIGSWFFHLVRMRLPLARHDGVVSAARAHRAGTLLTAARTGAPGFITRMFGARLWKLPVPRIMHTIVGIRPAYHDALVDALGARAGRLGPIT